MGERRSDNTFTVPFNRTIKIEAAEATLSEDPGVLLARTAAEQLGLIEALSKLEDPRDQTMIKYPLSEITLLRVLLFAQGWRHQDDADLMREDALFRLASSLSKGVQPINAPLPSQPTMSRSISHLVPEDLSQILLDMSIKNLSKNGLLKELIIDVDSFFMIAHGKQEEVEYNGHFHEYCLHPLIAFSEYGDLMALQLRNGRNHTSTGVKDFIKPVLDKAKKIADKVILRVDAGYPSGDFLDWLEEQDVLYLTRQKSYSTLKAKIEDEVDVTKKQWAAEPSEEYRTAFFEFNYQAGSWSKERTVLGVLVESSQHQRQTALFNNLFFLMTNDEALTAEEVLRKYRQRGLAEVRIGEFINELAPSLSSTELKRNQVTYLLAAIAYQLQHYIRQTIEKAIGRGISIRRLKERFLKGGTRIIRHARRIIVRIASYKEDFWKVAMASVLGTQTASEGRTA